MDLSHIVNLDKLKTTFPPEAIEWRVGAKKADGSKGLALAYLDARAVMERLDRVCGPENWQCRYSHADTKTVCEISIKINGEWVTKADGAGDTDFESVKGALSDAFKRAAYRWGIGRYLYDTKDIWVPLEQRGKSYVIPSEQKKYLATEYAKQFCKDFVGGPLGITELTNKLREFDADLRAAEDEDTIFGLERDYEAVLEQCKRDKPQWYWGSQNSDIEPILQRINRRKKELGDG